MTRKIQESHLLKPAYIYLRQSSMNQVRHNQESTERQYALRDKAMEMGWPADMIRILDGDLGLSGTRADQRKDFQNLVGAVSMRKVGAVFALEASRLSRSCTDWHRLLEICAFTDTLIIDEDGCYNPSDFNDQLLLGLKGTMSQAELHFLRARLQGGKLNKARKGELKSPLPVGYVYDDEGATVLDPDRQVRHALRFLFDSFRLTGSAYGVVHKFAQEGLEFPKRSYGGAWKGKLIWGRLTDSRVLAVLKNPTYAGAYVYGRYQSIKEIDSDGTFHSKSKRMPMDSWTVLIKDHHEGYVTWKDYMSHKKILESNRTNGEETLLSGPAREGLALLQGLLVCGCCGRRLTVRYKGNGGIYPNYECNWKRREGLSTSSCMHVRCDLVDDPVSARVLEVIKPKQIQAAIEALEEIERREENVDHQWRMKIERAEYEANLAQRRYEAVDPDNRLVAGTLEKRWNEALVRFEKVRQEFEQRKQKNSISATEEQKAQLLELAHDLPRLWKAPSTSAKDRKRILRLLIKDITVEKLAAPKQKVLHIRWQGGAFEDIPIKMPLRCCDQIRYPRETLEKVRKLSKDFNDEQIVSVLNQEGVKSAKGKLFTVSMIRWIRYKHRIPGPILKRPEEFTVQQIADKFTVSRNVVYYWIEREIITARRINQGSPYWITLSSQKEKELTDRVKKPTKISQLRIQNA
ncbi:MAG: recombinase family protein [Proteobacteria bacterium]|nr:recombinase family protein [Pseudomonadota bacterium]